MTEVRRGYSELRSVEDFYQQTQELLGRARFPTPQERSILEKRHYVFLPVFPISLGLLIGAYPNYFRSNQLQDLDAAPQLRDYALPTTTMVAVRPRHLEIFKSNLVPLETQLLEIEMFSRFDESLIDVDGAKAVMLPATAAAQADKAFFDISGGKKTLFRRGLANVIDPVTGLYLPAVGRNNPGDRLSVGGMNDSYFPKGRFAVPAVIFVD